jgi:hypothetical protein
MFHQRLVASGDPLESSWKEGLGLASDVDFLRNWNKQNVHVFRYNASTTTKLLVSIIKDEVTLWS